MSKFKIIKSNTLWSKYAKEGDILNLNNGDKVQVRRNRTTKCLYECCFNKNYECQTTGPSVVLEVLDDLHMYLCKNNGCLLPKGYHFEKDNQQLDTIIIKINKMLKNLPSEHRKYIISKITKEG